MSTEDNDYLRMSIDDDHEGGYSIVISTGPDRAFRLTETEALEYALRVLLVANLARWISAICRAGSTLGVEAHGVTEMAEHLATSGYVKFEQPLSFVVMLYDEDLKPGIVGIDADEQIIHWTPATAAQFTVDLVDMVVRQLAIIGLTRTLEAEKLPAWQKFIATVPLFATTLILHDGQSQMEESHDNLMNLIKDITGKDPREESS